MEPQSLTGSHNRSPGALFYSGCGFSIYLMCLFSSCVIFLAVHFHLFNCAFKFVGIYVKFNGINHLLLNDDDTVGMLETDNEQDLKPLNDRVLIKVCKG
ncbi:hypothetical protein L2E82_44756 [Cichorium intybus]|uniref:Uncharacterized protein n=1 Tax=Cichorium intybus TaxID=13427 RepID=A0ACB8ZR73_CICIN|nr:hypothetical protein L2E82_44756 [Cichorium intybus]